MVKVTFIKARETPMQRLTNKENNSSKTNRDRDRTESFASAVNFVTRLQKFNAHIQRIMFNVLRTNENSPNSNSDKVLLQ